MNKKYLVLGILLVLVIATVGSYYWLTTSSVRTAFANRISGQVVYNSGHGWQDVLPSTEFSLNDEIRTEDGSADIVLFESIIMTLDPHSNVVIKSLVDNYPKVELKAGSIWSKITGIGGVGHYDVITPNTVATVRGTFFGTALVDGQYEFVGGEGQVDLANSGSTTHLTQFQKFREDANGALQATELSAGDLSHIEQITQTVITALKSLRWSEIQKNHQLLSLAQNQYGVTTDKIQSTLDDIDAGRQDDVALAGMAPVHVESIDVVLALDHEIKEEQDLLSKIHARQAT